MSECATTCIRTCKFLYMKYQMFTNMKKTIYTCKCTCIYYVAVTLRKANSSLHLQLINYCYFPFLSIPPIHKFTKNERKKKIYAPGNYNYYHHKIS